MKLTWRLLIAAAEFSLIPAATQACSMCMLADPKTAGTYLTMTLFMSVLPLALLAGLGYWLWRRYSPRTEYSRSLARPAGALADGIELPSGHVASALEHSV